MEVLQAFGINWKLLLIQGVNFGLLLAILYRYLYKPLFAVLDKRQAEIAQGLKDAEASSKERIELADSKDAILQSAREEGGKIVDGLRKEGTEQERKIVRDAQEKSQALLSDAKQKAEEEKAYMLRESEKEVAKMAVLAAEKILRTAHTAT